MGKASGIGGGGVVLGSRFYLSSNTKNTGCSTGFAAAAVCEVPHRVQGELVVGFDERMSAVVVVVAAVLAAIAAGDEIGVVGVAENAGAGAAYKPVVDYAGLVC